MVPESYNLSWHAANFEVDRRALAIMLKTVEPASEKKTGKGVSRYWFVCDVAKAIYCGGEDAPDYMVEKARLTKAQAERAELEVAHKRGDLIELSVIESQYIGEMLNLKQRVFSLPSQIAPYLVDKTDAGEVEATITDALHEQFADFSSEATPSGDTADEENAQPVVG